MAFSMMSFSGISCASSLLTMSRSFISVLLLAAGDEVKPGAGPELPVMESSAAATAFVAASCPGGIAGAGDLEPEPAEAAFAIAGGSIPGGGAFVAGAVFGSGVLGFAFAGVLG